MKCIIVVLLFLIVLTSAGGLKILGLFNHAGLSHFYIFRPLLRALRDKGHEVTVMSYFPEKINKERYVDVTFKYQHEGLHVVEMQEMHGSRMEKYWGPFHLQYNANITCEVALGSKEYQKLLKTNTKFDIIISEFFNTNCWLLPLLDKFNSPLIGITSHILMPWTNDWVGNPDNPAYIPTLFLDHSDNQSFFERLENFVFLCFSKLYYSYVMEAEDYRQLRKHLGDSFTVSKDSMYKTSLILTNSHFSLNRPRPLVPNVVEVGGLHIGKAKVLPEDVEKWINDSTHGVIYFSMGSLIKGHTFPEEKRQMFLRAFARLPQRVLWKWETEEMPGKPDNVMLRKWMPQFDILCHPNVKAFIAHGGLLGVTESVHCGVPMLIMPQFGDQFTNAKAIEVNEGGVMLDFRYITEDEIYKSLTKILSSDFNKKAKELSARFRDRPMPPLETAIYWVEYVARHKGAPHLRTAAVGMPLYKYLLLDVIAFLLAILFVVSYVSYRVGKAAFKKICSRNKKLKTN